MENLLERIVACAKAVRADRVIMQGSPGTGKTTIAHQLVFRHPHAIIVSADDHMIVDGVYKFDPLKLSAAHVACQSKAKAALRQGQVVIVDNCNAKNEDVQPYMRLSNGAVVVVRLHADSVETALLYGTKSVHKVPDHAVKRCHDTIQPIQPGSAAVHYISQSMTQSLFEETFK